MNSLGRRRFLELRTPIVAAAKRGWRCEPVSAISESGCAALRHCQARRGEKRLQRHQLTEWGTKTAEGSGDGQGEVSECAGRTPSKRRQTPSRWTLTTTSGGRKARRGCVSPFEAATCTFWPRKCCDYKSVAVRGASSPLRHVGHRQLQLNSNLKRLITVRNLKLL